MIGKEERNEEEQPELKVTDRRKFNPDGSLREGVTIEPEEKTEPVDPPIVSAEPDTEEPVSPQDAPVDQSGEILGDDLPGADEPSSFVNFLSTLVSQAAAALGAMPHPVTGQRSVDLETGRYWIDTLTMLREKTDGNLLPQEKRLFDGLLSDLQLQYVSLAKASEEKLKAQAAKKFSSKDILGG